MFDIFLILGSVSSKYLSFAGKVPIQWCVMILFRAERVLSMEYT